MYDKCYWGRLGAPERIAAQEEAGADLHRVEIAPTDDASYKKTVAALVK